MTLLKLSAAVCCLGISAGGASALTVTQNDSPTDLANTILGSGVTITSATLTGAADASGTFTGGGDSIGIDDGVILSTGDVTDAEGPNTADDTTTNFGTAGDADLSAIVGLTTYDAVRLDLTFTSDTGSVFFNYAFASEEYNEFTNSEFNDVFALLLDGTNIALVPGSSDAVSINTVNGGNPLGVGASNPGLFNNNDLDDGGPIFNIEYDGFTNVFTATGTGLGIGVEHTLSFVIADTSDAILDSAIFIQGGSLGGEPPDPVPLPAGAWLMLGGLGALTAVKRRKKS